MNKYMKFLPLVMVGVGAVAKMWLNKRLEPGMVEIELDLKV